MLEEGLRLEGSPISHPLNVSTLPTKGRTIVVHPDEGALAALAEEMGLLAVSDLRAEVSVTRWQRDGVRLFGPLRAKVIQTCVVTLEPLESTLETQIEALFMPDTSKLARKTAEYESNAILIDPESDDAPETFSPPELDIGAAVHEFLALAIDPYPRAPDAESIGVQPSSTPDALTADPERPNPFAVLAKLKDEGAKDT
ncbi:MAG: DUF177 domain-containing protein [Pseudomonadota bacterium]